jgi:hypothetical protein
MVDTSGDFVPGPQVKQLAPVARAIRDMMTFFLDTPQEEDVTNRVRTLFTLVRS